VSSPELRASDADRDRTIADLREHTAAGRLTLEEFSERVDQAVAARTVAELDAVRSDLPSPVPVEHGGRRPKRFTGVVFGNTQRTGRWRLPRRAFALSLFGDLDLDLRQAQLSGPRASITAFVVFGNVDVYVPESVDVDLDGLTVFGHRREWGRDLPSDPAAPLVDVRVFSLFGTADLWRVPLSWAARTFDEVIKGLRKGEHRELPPPATK
jgi:Domain of unknown function (DUF1707)/Cell wall-active antibiotics response 4TMS YvqF